MRVYGEVGLGRRGGSFVEVLVSLSLTAGAVMALLASITGMNRVHHRAQEIDHFSELAEARVESFRLAAATGSADTIRPRPRWLPDEFAGELRRHRGDLGRADIRATMDGRGWPGRRPHGGGAGRGGAECSLPRLPDSRGEPVRRAHSLGRSGFTLVELLVSLVLTGVIMAALSTSMVNGLLTHQRRRGEAQSG